MELPNAFEIKEMIIVIISLASLSAWALAVVLREWKDPINELFNFLPRHSTAAQAKKCATIFIPFDSSTKRRKADRIQEIVKLAELLREALESAEANTEVGQQLMPDGITLLVCGTSFETVRPVIFYVIDAYTLVHPTSGQRITVSPADGHDG